MSRIERRRRARHAEYARRVLIDGRLVHPDGPHGQTGTYSNRGCRCIPCTQAHYFGQDRPRARRQRKLRAVRRIGVDHQL